jgi:putative GTP pyrophosphokinase
MTVSVTSTPPDWWADEYRQSRSVYQRLAAEFEDLLRRKIEAEGLDVVHITSRTKTVDSFLTKLKQKKKYVDPLNEVTDLAGIRIVTYYLEDVERVAALVEQEFEVDPEKSVIKGQEEPDRFGYQSTHLIVTLAAHRRELVEYKELVGLWAEVQIRTATQHAWAAVEHRLGYKNPNDVSDKIARQLYRLSALFELADEQLSQVRQVTAQEKQEFGETFEEGNLDIPVDIASLEAYLDSRHPNLTSALAMAMATADGWTEKREPDSADPGRRERDVRDLARSLKASDILKIEAFDALLSDAHRASSQLELVAEQERNDTSGGAHPDAEAFDADIVNILLFLLVDASPELVESIYEGVTAQAIEKAIEYARPAPAPRSSEIRGGDYGADDATSANGASAGG